MKFENKKKEKTCATFVCSMAIIFVQFLSLWKRVKLTKAHNLKTAWTSFSFVFESYSTNRKMFKMCLSLFNIYSTIPLWFEQYGTQNLNKSIGELKYNIIFLEFIFINPTATI